MLVGVVVVPDLSDELPCSSYANEAVTGWAGGLTVQVVGG